MYDLRMKERESGLGIDVHALNRALALRDMTAADLAREAGVSKATLSLILNGQRANPTASVVLAIARALDVSSDYLLGLSSEPEPRELQLGELLVDITRVARKLPNRKQRDLLLIARTYLEDSQQPPTEAQLLTDLVEFVGEHDGITTRDQLIDLLDRLRNASGRSLPPVGSDNEQENSD